MATDKPPLTTRPGKKGIGLKLDLMLGALFHGDKLDVRTWSMERAHAPTSPPVPLAREGSANYWSVAWVLDLLARRRNARPADLLLSLYEGQTTGAIGHCGRETLSATYADAHLVPAHVVRLLAEDSKELAELRDPVSRFLENELALSVIHRDGERRVVSASTRAMTGLSDARDQWVAQVLGETLPHPGRGFRLLQFQAADIRSWLDPALVDDCRHFANTREVSTRLAAVLDRVRTVCGELRWYKFEEGHVSFYPEGPWCFAAPQPAAVGRTRAEPVLFNPAQDFRRPGIKGYADVVTSISLDSPSDPGVLRSVADGDQGPWRRAEPLAGLGLGGFMELRVVRKL